MDRSDYFSDTVLFNFNIAQLIPSTSVGTKCECFAVAATSPFVLTERWICAGFMVLVSAKGGSPSCHVLSLIHI